MPKHNKLHHHRLRRIAMAAAIFVINFCGYPAAAWLF
jgi:hypothetical protein